MKKKNLTLNDFKNSLVWSYTRVSTKDQFVNNGSIETQVNKIKAFAKENQLIITQEFDAEYESSKRINTQSTLKELMDRIKKTTVFTVVLGNPPYSTISQNRGEWITHLLEDYKREESGTVFYSARN